MALMNTTHGDLEEHSLLRTLGFEERPNEFVVWVEWRIPAHAGCAVCARPDQPRPVGGLVLVRRDAHVILKHPSATADALVGGIG